MTALHATLVIIHANPYLSDQSTVWLHEWLFSSKIKDNLLLYPHHTTTVIRNSSFHRHFTHVVMFSASLFFSLMCLATSSILFRASVRPAKSGWSLGVFLLRSFSSKTYLQQSDFNIHGKIEEIRIFRGFKSRFFREFSSFHSRIYLKIRVPLRERNSEKNENSHLGILCMGPIR
jgi:hypothetical protein